MEDQEVIRAFVADGAKRAFGPSLHIEGDCLFLDGWWQACFRVGPSAFGLRDEPPPGDSAVLETIAAELAAAGLSRVATNPRLLYAVTYAAIALGPVDWAMWAPDLASADAALAARASEDSFLDTGTAPVEDETAAADFSAELGGARRLSGLPASIVLTVGLSEEQVGPLRAALPECQFESRALDVDPEVCASVIPTVCIVDATEKQGEHFVMQMRASACGRFLPVVALTNGQGPPLGADTAVEASADPATWVTCVKSLLP